MTPDTSTIPSIPETGCCSETSKAPGSLPIVSDHSSKDACCSDKPDTDSTLFTANVPESASHTESCAHGASSTSADIACSPSPTSADSAAPDDAALIDALRQVIDPELMINIVDLGLVYSINHTDQKVLVEMTLTSPACPAGPQIISQAKMSLEKLPGVASAEIKLTMSPPWTPDRMTDDARDQLGIF